MRARTWDLLLVAAWPEISARWAKGVAASPRRVLVAVVASEGGEVVYTGSRRVDPGAPGAGVAVLHAAIGSMFREFPRSFRGRIQVRFERPGGEVVEAWEGEVDVAPAPTPAIVQIEREKTHRALLRADEAKTLAMVEMHHQAPGVIQAAAQAIVAAGGARAAPPVATASPGRKEFDGLIEEVLRVVGERVVGAGSEIPATETGAEQGLSEASRSNGPGSRTCSSVKPRECQPLLMSRGSARKRVLFRAPFSRLITADPATT